MEVVGLGGPRSVGGLSIALVYNGVSPVVSGGRGGRFRRRLDVAGVGAPVGGAAGFDDLPGERQSVDNGSAQPRR